jgi:hypothetical protein
MNQIHHRQSGGCVGLAPVIAELDFDCARGKNFDDSSHLAAHQTALGEIPQQRYLSQ